MEAKEPLIEIDFSSNTIYFKNNGRSCSAKNLPKDVLDLIILLCRKIGKAMVYIETLENVHIELGENKYNITKMYASEKDFVKDLLNILGGEEKWKQ